MTADKQPTAEHVARALEEARLAEIEETTAAMSDEAIAADLAAAGVTASDLAAGLAAEREAFERHAKRAPGKRRTFGVRVLVGAGVAGFAAAAAAILVVMQVGSLAFVPHKTAPAESGSIDTTAGAGPPAHVIEGDLLVLRAMEKCAAHKYEECLGRLAAAERDFPDSLARHPDARTAQQFAREALAHSSPERDGAGGVPPR